MTHQAENKVYVSQFRVWHFFIPNGIANKGNFVNIIFANFHFYERKLYEAINKLIS